MRSASADCAETVADRRSDITNEAATTLSTPNGSRVGAGRCRRAIWGTTKVTKNTKKFREPSCSLCSLWFATQVLCGSHHIGVQLVVMSPEALVNVVKEPARILPRAPNAVEHAGLGHVVGAVALAHAIDRAVVDRLHHVVVGLQLRSAHHRTV